MVNKRGGFEWDEYLPWLIALACLVLGFILYKILFGKSGGALAYLKDNLGFG